MLRNYKSSLVSVIIVVDLFYVLQTLLPLFVLFFAKSLLGIGLILRSLLCTLCALYYAAIVFLLCQTLLNPSKLKVMHPTLLYVVYLYSSTNLFTNPLPSSARHEPVVRKTMVFMTMSCLQSLLVAKLVAPILMSK